MLTVRYFAGARAAAGVAEERITIAGPTGPSLDELAMDLTGWHGPRLGHVLRAASFLVNGVSWHDRRAPLPMDATVDVLPPFAGG